MTDYRAIVALNGLPNPPDGRITSATWRASHDDWFVHINGRGWFWLDSKSRNPKEWLPSEYGP